MSSVAADGGALPDPGWPRCAAAHPQVVGAAPFIAAQGLVARGEGHAAMLLRGIDPDAGTRVTALAGELADGAAAAAAGLALEHRVGGARRALGPASATGHLVAPGGQVTPAGVVPRLKRISVVGVFDTGPLRYDSAGLDPHRRRGAHLPAGGADRHPAPLRTCTRPRAGHARAGGHGQRRPAVRDWTRQNRTWFAAVQLEKRMMFIILTLIVAVAAFNLVSTLVMTVTDKRADIAILRTLGASPRKHHGDLRGAGRLAGVIGTLAGLLLGLPGWRSTSTSWCRRSSALGARFLPQDIYLISRMPSDPQAGDIVPIAAISLVLAFVATLYPSWRASRSTRRGACAMSNRRPRTPAASPSTCDVVLRAWCKRLPGHGACST